MARYPGELPGSPAQLALGKDWQPGDPDTPSQQIPRSQFGGCDGGSIRKAGCLR